MRIVFLQDDFPPEARGGAGIVASLVAAGLRERGHSVSVITTTGVKAKEGKTDWEGIPVYRIYSDYSERWRAWRSLYNPRVVREARRLLSILKPEIVHAHNIHYHLSYGTLCEAKKAGAPVLFTAHDAMAVAYGKITGVPTWRESLKAQKMRFNPFRNACIRRALSCVSGIAAVSAALAEALARAGLRNIEVIRNGIDAARWRADARAVAAFKAAHNLTGRPVILFGGRISAAKGGDAIIAALHEVLKTHPHAALLLVGGETPYVRALRERAPGRAVIATGWISGGERVAAYHAADLVVVPSLYLDPLPTVVLEAMACGKPVVGTSFGGTKEMVAEGETGYIVDPHNTKEIAGRISMLLSDAALRERMGAAGLARVRTEFSLGTQLTALEAWYQSSRR